MYQICYGAAVDVEFILCSFCVPGLTAVLSRAGTAFFSEGIYSELQVSRPCGLYGTIVRGTMAQKAWEPLLCFVLGYCLFPGCPSRKLQKRSSN